MNLYQNLGCIKPCKWWDKLQDFNGFQPSTVSSVFYPFEKKYTPKNVWVWICLLGLWNNQTFNLNEWLKKNTQMFVNLPGLSVFCFFGEGKQPKHHRIKQKRHRSPFSSWVGFEKSDDSQNQKRWWVSHHVSFEKKPGVVFYLFPSRSHISHFYLQGMETLWVWNVFLHRVSWSPRILDDVFEVVFSSCGNGTRLWRLMVQKEFRFHVDGPLLMMGSHYTIPGEVVFSMDFWSINSTNGVHFFVEILTLGPPTWTNRYMGKLGP